MAFIGTALLRRLIAQRAKLPLEEVDQVLDAFNEVTLDVLKSGAKIRMLGGQGYFMLKDIKPTRKLNPKTKELVEIPAKQKIVYKESRRK